MSTTKPARPSVKLVAGHATTTSTAVAQFFGRRHKDVLRAIENLKAECEAAFYERNFAPIQIDVDLGQGRTRKDPAYQLTRDGFTLLAMGFTGKAALAWKIKYIEAFNKLEERATQRAVVVATRKIAADQAAERRKALPAPEGIDVRSLLLKGQSDPTLPLPAEIQSALNRKAWTMAHEVYELLCEHLARRVAYTSEMGSPRYLNEKRALEAIEECNINQALAHSYRSEIYHCALLAKSALNIAAEFNATIQKALKA